MLKIRRYDRKRHSSRHSYIGTVRIRAYCPDNDIIHPVAIDVPSASDAKARVIECVDAVHDKAVAAIEVRDVEGCGKPGAATEHDIALARPIETVWVRPPCDDDDIIQSIAVDVADAGDVPAGSVVYIGAVHDKTVTAIEVCQIEGCGKPGAATEHDIALASVIGTVRIRVGRRDDDIIQPVAIHVPGSRNAPTRGILCADSVHD
jgi:hypothetical protein